MHKKLFLFFIGAMIFLPLCSMDGNSENYDFAIQHVIIPNTAYDYYVHRTLAQLNTVYNKMIEDNYRPDKKRIEELMLAKGTPPIRGQVSWNKDFSQCAWATVKERAHPFDSKKLKITLVNLVDKKDIFIEKSRWDGYMNPSFGDTLTLFFNKYGAACCHVYGLIEVYGEQRQYRAKDDFLEYSLDCNGQAEKKRCVVKVNDSSIECDLKEVCHIPAVMKAFLQSPYECACEGAAFDDIIKVYKLKNVIFPEEYKEYADPQYWIDCAKLSSYHDDCSGYSNF